jgi:hypothetical protein
MATTTNYGWTTPNDTDLVKDGAAAIRTLGSSIDTTVFNNASAGIAKTIVDAKGDIIAATAADTVARLAVGANGTVLTADSAEATGLKWVAGGAPTTSYTLINTGGTTLSGSSTITISGLSGYNELLIVSTGFIDTVTDGGFNFMTFNSDNGSNYNYTGYRAAISASGGFTQESGRAETYYRLTQQQGSQGFGQFAFRISAAKSTGIKPIEYKGYDGGGGTNSMGWAGTGWYAGTSAISSLSISNTQSSNFSTGTIFIYGAN